MMGCSHCGINNSGEEKNDEEKETYQCQACGSMSDKEGMCCGENMKKACKCNSGNFSPDCCHE